MISGVVVDGREPIVELVVLNAAGDAASVDFVLDTGFTAALTLPLEMIAQLQLPQVGTDFAKLADGAVVETGLYESSVIWNEAVKTVQVHEADFQPLLGMGLLLGSRIEIDVVDGGRISITSAVSQ